MNRSLEIREHAMKVMRSFNAGMLVSISGQQRLRARPMAIAKLLESGDFWFFTDRNSEKVSEILSEPNIAITLQNANQYVSLSGKARLVDDRSKVDELWSESWKVWFPEGKDDPSIALVYFSPEEVEFWDNAGVRGLRYLFEAGIAYVKGEAPNIGEDMHAKLNP